MILQKMQLPSVLAAILNRARVGAKEKMMGEGCLKAVPLRDLDIYDAEVIVGSQQGAVES